MGLLWNYIFENQRKNWLCFYCTGVGREAQYFASTEKKSPKAQSKKE